MIFLFTKSTNELNPENKKDFGVIGAFVLHLAKSIPEGTGHKLFFDNYFTSWPVLAVLLDKKNICCWNKPFKLDREMSPEVRKPTQEARKGIIQHHGE